MKRFIVILVSMFALSFGQIENWNGWGDTASIVNFYADTTIYSGWFKLSSFSIVRHTLYLDDTSAAGFDTDSCSAEWGIQTGYPSFLTTNVYRRKMALARKTVLDTFNTTAGGVFSVDSAAMITIDNQGYPVFTGNRIDTLIDSMGTMIRSPYAYQAKCPLQEWDVYYRYWIRGLTGNLTGKHIKGYFQSARQTGIKVKTND